MNWPNKSENEREYGIYNNMVGKPKIKWEYYKSKFCTKILSF